ncbi:DNA fragmentation factor-related protein 4 isoform X2 [Lycorma delicatula]|uniref:DNA fragmentation factor-related protein 4 isoform X2 n=1 Tax=Lycorma delicatula TaxID=130591 RepID=UPI003F50DFBB
MVQVCLLHSRMVKGYKVTDCNRAKRFGVACSSLKELIEKGCKKLNIDQKDVKVHLQDGTAVDTEEYFSTLPSQTFFVLKEHNEYLPSGADIIYNALKAVNIDVLRTGDLVTQYFDERIKEKLQVLWSAVTDQRIKYGKNKSIIGDTNILAVDKTEFSTREEDPDWFIGLETNAKTKESFMFKRSQDRIRGYYYKTQNDIRKNVLVLNDSNVTFVIDNVFNELKSTLMKDQYFGCYFDRSQIGAMCDKYGEFTCGGVWKERHCLYTGSMLHVINPYSSREERILFSTWNLDHCIERSRSIIPALTEASVKAAYTNDGSLTVNTSYFYSLLFTSSNLRLVHVVCHDKGKLLA